MRGDGGRARAPRWWGREAEFAAREDDGDGDYGAVELGFVHVRDGVGGGGDGGVDYVGGTPVRIDWMLMLVVWKASPRGAVDGSATYRSCSSVGLSRGSRRKYRRFL